MIKLFLKILLILLSFENNIVYFNEDSGNAVFSCNEMGIVSINLNNMNLDDTSYDEDNPETITHIRPLAWHVKFEKCKTFKKELNKELMLIAWHPR